MNIGFDARLIKETGVGRYIKNLLPLLISKNKKNTWVILIRPNEKEFLISLLKKDLDRVQIVEVKSRWHSFKEQIEVPYVLYKNKLDIVHIPYINVPVFYFKKMIVTIHDLTLLTHKTGEASTLNPLFYAIRRLGFNVALKKALKADRILVVSQSVKQEILKKYPKIDYNKIIVSYNGLPKLKYKQNKSFKAYLQNRKPYFFYVGNAHPHKNLNFLIDTLDKFFTRFPNYKLILAGRKDFFMDKLLTNINQKRSKDNFIFIDNPSDSELYQLYKNANCVVLPSLKEGFGLQILEAMQLESLIVCSSISSYKEIGGDLCTFFDPLSQRSLVLALNKVLKITAKHKKQITSRYKAYLRRFSWEDSAEDILKAYSDKQYSSKKLIINPFK